MWTITHASRLSSLPGNDVEEMPVLRLPDIRLIVALLDAEHLDVEPREELMNFVQRVMCTISARGPRVAITEELPGESTTGTDCGNDPFPQIREMRGFAEGECKACVDEIAWWKRCLLEADHFCRQRITTILWYAWYHELECRRLGVRSMNTPSTIQQLECVPSLSRGQIDRESARHPFVLE